MRTASRCAASLGIVTMLRDSDWAREGYQPEDGAFTAEKWLENWVAHDTTHINQIERTLNVYADQAAGQTSMHLLLARTRSPFNASMRLHL
jgi:hypothetical protein